MELKNVKNMTADETFSFDVNGRTGQEIKEMRNNGYVELVRFKAHVNKPRTDGYFCGSCKHFKSKEFTLPDNASTHDGVCVKFKFRVTDFGCCSGWTARTGLFAYNPA